MSYLALARDFLTLLKEMLPGIAQVLLGAAALVTAWQGRKKAKEKVNEKRKG